nr:acetyltransferase [uncultured Flavobacterium sp.]
MYLFGGNGHGKVVLDILQLDPMINIETIFDDSPKVAEIGGIPVCKTSSLDFFRNKELIIAIGNNQIRKRIATQIEANYLSAIHPKAILGFDVLIGTGTVVLAGAIINPSVRIGKHCIVNTGAVVEHDCVLGDFVHVSPNTSLAGNVTIGEGTHVGIGACVIQGVKVGKWVTVGAGAVILNDVPDYAVIVGNPGKIIKYNSVENG